MQKLHLLHTHKKYIETKATDFKMSLPLEVCVRNVLWSSPNIIYEQSLFISLLF